MIKIPNINIEGHFEPQRALTVEERSRVIGCSITFDYYVFFESGDENTPEYLSYLESLESEISEE